MYIDIYTYIYIYCIQVYDVCDVRDVAVMYMMHVIYVIYTYIFFIYDPEIIRKIRICLCIYVFWLPERTLEREIKGFVTNLAPLWLPKRTPKRQI